MSTNKTFTKTLITAAVLAAAVLGGQAYASGPKDSGISGDRYGYVFRGNDARSVYTDGARPDPYTDGAKVGKFDPTPTAPASWRAWTAAACRPSRLVSSIRTRMVPRSASSTRTPMVPASWRAWTQRRVVGTGPQVRPVHGRCQGGKFDPYTDGARIVAGPDRSGVSSEPAARPTVHGWRQGRQVRPVHRRRAGLMWMGVVAAPAGAARVSR